SIVVLTLLPKKLLNKTSELQLDPIEISALPPKNSLTKTIKLIEFQLDFIEVLVSPLEKSLTKKNKINLYRTLNYTNITHI
ncbi:7571_t:CDS:1, partial [Funneliformis geosporum]